MDKLVFKGHEIRILTDSGQTWLALCDICDSLDIVGQKNFHTRLPFEDIKAAYTLTDPINLSKYEHNMNMIGFYGLQILLQTSRKPLARVLLGWLLNQKKITRLPNQKEAFSDQVNLYDYTDKTYGLRMAAKILGLSMETFPPWVAENFLHPDGHTPHAKHAGLFHVKVIIDPRGRRHFQVFLTDPAYTFFNRPANRMTLPSSEVVPWDPRFPDKFPD